MSRAARLLLGALLSVLSLTGLAAAVTTPAVAAAPALAHPVRTLFGSVPNDTAYWRQASYLRAIDLPKAWRMRHGSRSIRIAVLDTGVAVQQPDLRGKIVGTYNAVSGGRSVTDTIGHGTFVAGIAAAATNNRRGIAGVGYAASILAVKICKGETCDVAPEIRGIHWAVAHGADVINLSFGGAQQDASEAAAVAWAQRQGVVVVAAAGNDSTTKRYYPAADPGVIAVGATNPVTHRRAGFSNHGSWVTVAAPGSAVYSTTPWHSRIWGRGNYGTGEGTSFAAPMVAGEVALLRAAAPTATVAQVRAAVADTAHGYRGAGLGSGQIDVAAALRRVIAISRIDARR